MKVLQLLFVPVIVVFLQACTAKKNIDPVDDSDVMLSPDGAKEYRVRVKYYDVTILTLYMDEHANLTWAGGFNLLEGLKSFDDSVGKIPTNVSDKDLT